MFLQTDRLLFTRLNRFVTWKNDSVTRKYDIIFQKLTHGVIDYILQHFQLKKIVFTAKRRIMDVFHVIRHV